MTRLYRKGKQVDWGSGWFTTIDEALEHPTKEKIISIMWIRKEEFEKHFEENGIGYRPKNINHYAQANPVVETMIIEEFLMRLEHPIMNRFYNDGSSQYLM